MGISIESDNKTRCLDCGEGGNDMVRWIVLGASMLATSICNLSSDWLSAKSINQSVLLVSRHVNKYLVESHQERACVSFLAWI